MGVDAPIPVTWDQEEFNREATMVDWGALVTDSQDGVHVYVCAMSKDTTARMLRAAADAVERAQRDDAAGLA